MPEKPEKKPEPAVVSLPPDVEASLSYVQTFCVNLPPREQHNAFCVQMASRGWAYGVSVDARGKKHPWVTHWKHLPAAERDKQATIFNKG